MASPFDFFCPHTACIGHKQALEVPLAETIVRSTDDRNGTLIACPHCSTSLIVCENCLGLQEITGNTLNHHPFTTIRGNVSLVQSFQSPSSSSSSSSCSSSSPFSSTPSTNTPKHPIAINCTKCGFINIVDEVVRAQLSLPSLWPLNPTLLRIVQRCINNSMYVKQQADRLEILYNSFRSENSSGHEEEHLNSAPVFGQKGDGTPYSTPKRSTSQRGNENEERERGDFVESISQMKRRAGAKRQRNHGDGHQAQQTPHGAKRPAKHMGLKATMGRKSGQKLSVADGGQGASNKDLPLTLCLTAALFSQQAGLSLSTSIYDNAVITEMAECYAKLSALHDQNVSEQDLQLLTSFEYCNRFRLFAKCHYKMLRALYGDELTGTNEYLSAQYKELFGCMESFMMRQGDIIKVKRNAEVAFHVWNRAASVMPKEEEEEHHHHYPSADTYFAERSVFHGRRTVNILSPQLMQQRIRASADQIITNILFARYSRYRELLLRYTKPFARLLEGINKELTQLYHQLANEHSSSALSVSQLLAQQGCDYLPDRFGDKDQNYPTVAEICNKAALWRAAFRAISSCTHPENC